MFSDLFEFQDIFASHLTTAIFIYATIAMIAANAVLALTLSLQDDKPRAVRLLHRAV
jgi:hypothetical protein